MSYLGKSGRRYGNRATAVDNPGEYFEYAGPPTKDIQPKNRESVLALANRVWEQEFGVSLDDSDPQLSNSFVVVLYRRCDSEQPKEVLSAARYVVHEDGTGTRTANIYGVVSSIKRHGYGKRLLQHLRTHLIRQCEFMKVEITRPVITRWKAIEVFNADPIEQKFWSTEQPTESARAIQSAARTERVHALLCFYKACGFKHQITPGSDFTKEGDNFVVSTEYGPIVPHFAYSLVATTSEDSYISNACRRLSVWNDDAALEINYNRFPE